MVGEETSVPDLKGEDGLAPGLMHRLDDNCDSEDRATELFIQLKLNLGHLTGDESQLLRSLLASYSDVFAIDSSNLGTTELMTHSINTGEHRPVRQPVRYTPFAFRTKVDQEMLEQGVLEPSGSPWASRIVLVQKKDGEVRFCVDYRSSNN